MASNNPFDQAEIVEKYELWYTSIGKQSAHQEKNLLGKLLKRFEDVHSLLEVGCGTGYFTEWFKTWGLSTFGLDRSEKMLQEAGKLHHVICCQGDALRLPFQSGTFDLVSLITTLAFLSDPIQALTEAFRVTRKGIILGVINKHSLLGGQYRQKGGPIWDVAHLYTMKSIKDMVSDIVSQPYKMICKTTLWPIIPGISPLPWGGFIGLAVILNPKRR